MNFEKDINYKLVIGIAALIVIGGIIALFVLGESGESKQARADAVVCVESYESVIDGLSEIDTKTDVGVNYDEYSEIVTEVTTEADILDKKNFGEDCETLIENDIQDVLETYSDISNEWNDCLYDYYCELGYDFVPSDRWIEASSDIDVIVENFEIVKDISEGDTKTGDYEKVTTTSIDSSTS
jgi:hypothetical protein